MSIANMLRGLTVMTSARANAQSAPGGYVRAPVARSMSYAAAARAAVRAPAQPVTLRSFLRAVADRRASQPGPVDDLSPGGA